MATITMKIKLDEDTHHKVQSAALKNSCLPDQLVRQAISDYLADIETKPSSLERLPILSPDLNHRQAITKIEHITEKVTTTSVLRTAITSAWRRPENEVVTMLMDQARLSDPQIKKTTLLATTLAEKLRQKNRTRGYTSLVQNLLQEFSLSSQEGVALMCLAEALLRIPDKTTRNALIRDKVSKGDWQSHLSHSPSLFVNATTWGLLFTGRLLSMHNETNLSTSLNHIIRKTGEPLIRKGVDVAIRLMGEQFIIGESIDQALTKAHKKEEKGFRYSYDMLGEAALTANDAERYLLSYQQAITAIGKASNGRGIYQGPGISIKLSALHPRYHRSQYRRVMDELYPRLKALTLLARSYDIGINIDAEEADRLELSLDLMEKLCFDTELEGWNGIGFVVQAYMKRCPFAIDYLIALAQRSRRRLMIRLVKGAYWDSEIKRTQQEGLEDYPVYTRKVYTDVCYLACARKLLAQPHHIYPQFATHNAHTLAAIYQLAGNNYYPGQYEFQCLHGMGEPLYEQVVGSITEGKLDRPCRIYAPVGTYDTLLAYLVRRLLENGANTSFVHRIADNSLPIDELVADPVSVVEKMAAKEGGLGLPHPKIPLPCHLYGKTRQNSVGLDLANEHCLISLSSALLNNTDQKWLAQPIIEGSTISCPPRPVVNPANSEDIVGEVRETDEQTVSIALDASVNAGTLWQTTPPQQRADILERAALLMEQRRQCLVCILVREAGKTYSNAIAEVREAVDFLRYYAAQVRNDFDNATHHPLGSVVCISPWNFPLAIFTGQIAAALAAGNSVLAKPAEQTPLIAMQATEILLEAGIPHGVLQLLPGCGETIGARLISDQRVCGVMFTGSTAVATQLNRTLAEHLDPQDRPVPLIAETGGVNAMIVDSSALIEQVVTDVIASAFDSAGQRCSALRLLCLQHDIADMTLEMLRGAMAECRMGNPAKLATDIGPVIDNEAKETLERHIQMMRAKGFNIYQATSDNDNLQKNGESLLGTFVTPTLIELNKVEDLDKEVFGPVLHVVRFASGQLPSLIEQINASGYGLTLGIHSRIQETINQVIQQAKVGNRYVNRNMVGAVVGVQPFGGEGLSGTGPKAGGPVYLYRLLSQRPDNALCITLDGQNNKLPIEIALNSVLLTPHQALSDWAQNNPPLAALCRHYAELSLCGTQWQLTGPTGECNIFSLLPRGRILCLSDNDNDRLIQLAAATSTGNRILWPEEASYYALFNTLPKTVQNSIDFATDVMVHTFDAVIHHGHSDELHALCVRIAAREGALISAQGYRCNDTHLQLERLLTERSLSINTAAVGGNASLMTMD